MVISPMIGCVEYVARLVTLLKNVLELQLEKSGKA